MQRSLTPPPHPCEIEGARPGPLPDRIEPELATLASAAPVGDDWLHEIKFDGYRLLCRIEDGAARLFTRHGVDWTERFSTLLDSLKQVPARRVLLDGEVVYVMDDGRTSFRQLAGVLQSGDGPAGRVVYYVFDLLHLDGCDLTVSPLSARKAALRGLLGGLAPSTRIRCVEHIEGHGAEFFRHACRLSLEGSIAKRRTAAYRPGRGRDWIKVKCGRRQEFIVAGFTKRADARDGVGALLMGYRRETGGPIFYAGRVGTGWDEKRMRDLRVRLDRLRQDEPPYAEGPHDSDALWVRPELVAEIEYLTWSGREGFRHASFEGLRFDKPSAEVVPENTRPLALSPVAPPPDAAGGPGERRGVARAQRRPAHTPAAATASGEPGGRRQRPAQDEAPRGPKSTARRSAQGQVLRRAGKRAVVGGVVITNPERVVFPDPGLTKIQLARYYESVAQFILPQVVRRPLTIVRCPAGYTRGCFFQRHADDAFPETILRVPAEEGGEMIQYLAVDSLAGLLSLVQLGVLEFHIWGSRIETVEYPDLLVFDLDPDPALPFARVADGAHLVCTLLNGLGLKAFVKTTGGKGLHVIVPILPTLSWTEARAFTRAIAEKVARTDPQRYVSTMSLKERTGKIFIDYLRNGRGATHVAAYSTRRHPEAPVSTPLRWDEVGAATRSGRYTARNLRRRLSALADDPWRGFMESRREITPDMRRSVGAKLDSRR